MGGAGGVEAAHGTPVGPCLSGPAALHILELPCPHHAKQGDDADADADALQLRAAGVERIGL